MSAPEDLQLATINDCINSCKGWLKESNSRSISCLKIVHPIIYQLASMYDIGERKDYSCPGLRAFGSDLNRLLFTRSDITQLLKIFKLIRKDYVNEVGKNR